MVRTICTVLMISAFSNAVAQQTIPLYSGAIPGNKPGKNEERTEDRNGVKIVQKISEPTITVYQVPKEAANGAAVVVFPGGGYAVNAIQHEGHDIARKFNEMGVTAFVVKYRIPDDNRMSERKFGPLQDAQQAIAYARKNASRYNVDPARIGIIGFSAGGHLASTAGTHFDRPVVPQEVSVRPDFMILVYPVISMQPDITHGGSRENLLGKNPDANDLELFSNEMQVTANTPPTILIHAADDGAVPVENSLRFYSALLAKKVKAELHVYPEGGHGFGLVNRTTPDLWMDRVRNWLTSLAMVPKN